MHKSIEMGNGRQEQCFTCDKPATSREHVPPGCIFPSPVPSNINLITVPACEKCNNGSKKDDEYFKAIITMGSAKNAVAEENFKKWSRKKITDKMPAILHHLWNNRQKVLVQSTGGIVIPQPAFRYDRSRIQRIVDKIVKGLFMHEHGERFGDQHVVDDFVFDPHKIIYNIIRSLPLKTIWEDIFSYRYIHDERDKRKGYWYLMFYQQKLIQVPTALKK